MGGWRVWVGEVIGQGEGWVEREGFERVGRGQNSHLGVNDVWSAVGWSKDVDARST